LLALDFVISAESRDVFDHWRSRMVAGSPPARRVLDPIEMARALPFVWIAEQHVRRSGRYFLRLAGEEVNRLFGGSIRHRFIDEILPAALATEVEHEFDLVVNTPAVMWTFGPFFEAAPGGPSGECAVFPLVGDDGCGAVLGVTIHRGGVQKLPYRLLPIGRERRVLTLDEISQEPR
jgi:hypothetical protein